MSREAVAHIFDKTMFLAGVGNGGEKEKAKDAHDLKNPHRRIHGRFLRRVCLSSRQVRGSWQWKSRARGLRQTVEGGTFFQDIRLSAHPRCSSSHCPRSIPRFSRVCIQCALYAFVSPVCENRCLFSQRDRLLPLRPVPRLLTMLTHCPLKKSDARRPGLKLTQLTDRFPDSATNGIFKIAKANAERRFLLIFPRWYFFLLVALNSSRACCWYAGMHAIRVKIPRASTLEIGFSFKF